MIRGKTHMQKFQDKQAKLRKQCRIRKTFAILPIEIQDGRTAWLQFVYWLPLITVSCSTLQCDPPNKELQKTSSLVMDIQYYPTLEAARNSGLYDHWRKHGLNIP